MSVDVAPPKAWEQVVAWVEERVLNGDLVVGSQLPAERDLAVRVGVSRPAVREAVRTLQASGVVRSAVGAGGTGGTTITGAPHQALTRLLRLHVALNNFPTADVTQVRIALERLSVQLASDQPDPQMFARLREFLARMDDDALSIEDFNDLDTKLHVTIAEAAGNRLVTDMTVAIRESMRLPILAGLGALDDWPGMRAALRAEHHAIVDALAAHHPDQAADLVEAHIRGAYARMPALHGK
jgi:DNA-binding FadR family transcriptional regulator